MYIYDSIIISKTAIMIVLQLPQCIYNLSFQGAIWLSLYLPFEITITNIFHTSIYTTHHLTLNHLAFNRFWLFHFWIHKRCHFTSWLLDYFNFGRTFDDVVWYQTSKHLLLSRSNLTLTLKRLTFPTSKNHLMILLNFKLQNTYY